MLELIALAISGAATAGVGAAKLLSKNAGLKISSTSGTTGVYPSKWGTHTKNELNFLRFLDDFVKYYHSTGGSTGYGELGYVRFNRAFHNDGSRWYYQPSCWDPITGEQIGTGNYTDMVHYINYSANILNRPTDWGFTGLSFSERQGLVDNYFDSDATLKSTLGRNGPHSSYISSLLSSIDVGKAYKVIVDVGLAIGAVTATIATGGAAAPADIAVLAKIKSDFA